MGTTQSAASRAGSTQGVLRIKLAMLRAQAGLSWNLKSCTSFAQGKPYVTAAYAASMCGGFFVQAAHWRIPGNTGKAHRLQRTQG